MKHWLIALFLSLAPLAAQDQPAPQGGERTAEGWRQRVEQAQQRLQQAREQLQRLQQERADGERRGDGPRQRPQGVGSRRGPGARDGSGPRRGRGGEHGRPGGRSGVGDGRRSGPGTRPSTPPMVERLQRLRSLRAGGMDRQGFQRAMPPQRGFGFPRPGVGQSDRSVMLERLRQLRERRDGSPQPRPRRGRTAI